MKNSLLLLVLLITMSCTKSDDQEQTDSIIGTWVLEKYCQSPGDNSCPWQTPDREYTYTFNTDGTYSSNMITESCSGKYEILLDTSIQKFHKISFTDHNTESGCNDHQKWLFFREDGKIQVSPICIEECTYIFSEK